MRNRIVARNVSEKFNKEWERRPRQIAVSSNQIIATGETDDESVPNIRVNSTNPLRGVGHGRQLAVSGRGGTSCLVPSVEGSLIFG